MAIPYIGSKISVRVVAVLALSVLVAGEVPFRGFEGMKRMDAGEHGRVLTTHRHNGARKLQYTYSKRDSMRGHVDFHYDAELPETMPVGGHRRPGR